MIRFLKYSINIPTPMNINIKLVNCTGEARSYHIKVNEKKKDGVSEFRREEEWN